MVKNKVISIIDISKRLDNVEGTLNKKPTFVEKGMCIFVSFIILFCLLHCVVALIHSENEKQFISNRADFRQELRNSLTSNDRSITIGYGGCTQDDVLVVGADGKGIVEKICLTTTEDTNDKLETIYQNLYNDKIEALYKYLDLKYVDEISTTTPAHCEPGYVSKENSYLYSFATIAEAIRAEEW